MAEEGSRDIANAVVAAFSGLGDFFSLFDMSFFVSGAACLGAIVFVVFGGKAPNVEHANNVVGFVALVTVCYLLGLIMFTVGRGMRSMVLAAMGRLWSKRASGAKFNARARAYGLAPSKLWRMDADIEPAEFYSLGWGLIRQMPECQQSLRFINKFWAMAATFDGAGASALVWAVAFVLRWDLGAYLIAAVFVLLAMFCFTRADMYEDHQERELAATLAVAILRDRSDS